MSSDSVVLFNPAISSINLGDHIIAESAKAQISTLLEGRHAVEVSTHLPLSWQYMRLFRASELKLVLGSNLLRGRMNGVFRQWDITPKSAPLARGSLLMGAGWWQYGDDPNRYTSALYRYVLSKDRQHSVRDEFTARQLRGAGITNVLVTGCPTLWSLTPGQLSTIPTGPGDRVVTTITDYAQSSSLDREMLMNLVSSYREVLFWPQGTRDIAYLESLELPVEPTLLAPTLRAFDEALDVPGTDYVGTRLHAGIRALQRSTRAAVVAIDNRAREMSRNFGLPTIEHGDVAALTSWSRGSDPLEMTLPRVAIDAWKRQF